MKFVFLLINQSNNNVKQNILSVVDDISRKLITFLRSAIFQTFSSVFITFCKIC